MSHYFREVTLTQTTGAQVADYAVLSTVLRHVRPLACSLNYEITFHIGGIDTGT